MAAVEVVVESVLLTFPVVPVDSVLAAADSRDSMRGFLVRDSVALRIGPSSTTTTSPPPALLLGSI